jgi:hypothetical protein
MVMCRLFLEYHCTIKFLRLKRPSPTSTSKPNNTNKKAAAGTAVHKQKQRIKKLGGGIYGCRRTKALISQVKTKSQAVSNANKNIEQKQIQIQKCKSG